MRNVECSETEQALADPKYQTFEWLCRGVDDLQVVYEQTFYCEGFALTVRRRDYLARLVVFSVEDAGYGEPNEIDIERIVRKLYAWFDTRNKGHIETMLWRKGNRDLEMMFTLGVPANEVKLPPDFLGWKYATKPRSVNRELPKMDCSPGASVPVYRTGIWSLKH